MSNERPNEALESLKHDFHNWKNNNHITKLFLSHIQKELANQNSALANIYIMHVDPLEKLIALGARSHSIKFLQYILNLSATDIQQEFEESLK